MTGAGSNMLQAHAYVKLLAVTTWIIAIWPFLSSWSGSFILWFNIGFEIPRRTDPHLYSTTAGGHGHSMGCAVGGGACGAAHSTVLVSPLGNRCCACAQSGDLALLEGCISSLTGSLPLRHDT